MGFYMIVRTNGNAEVYNWHIQSSKPKFIVPKPEHMIVELIQADGDELDLK